MLPLFLRTRSCTTLELKSAIEPDLLKFLFNSIEAIEPMDSSYLSADQEFLIGYVNYMRMYIAGSRFSFTTFMHSTVCIDFPCYCEVYFALASHYDNCHCFDCDLCRPARSSFVTVHHPLGSSKQEAGRPTEDILPPAKLPEMRNTSSSRIGLSDLAASSKTQPLGPQQLPPVLQWPETSAPNFTCTQVAVVTPIPHIELIDGSKEPKMVPNMSSPVGIWRSTGEPPRPPKKQEGGKPPGPPKMQEGGKLPRPPKKQEAGRPTEEILPPAKLPEMRNTSSSRIGVSGVAASSKTQPLGPQQLPPVQQWPETSAPNFTSTEVAVATPTWKSTSTNMSGCADGSLIPHIERIYGSKELKMVPNMSSPVGIWRATGQPPRPPTKQEGSRAPKEMPPPSKRLKTGNPSICSGVGASEVAGSSTVQPRGLEQLPCLQQWPEASALKDVCTSTASSGSVGTEVELKSDLESTIASHKEQQKTVPKEGTDNVKKIISDLIQLLDYPSVDVLAYDHEEEEREVSTMSDQAKLEITSDLLAAGADSKMGMEGPKLAGVSLVDFFTLEETEEHLFSLRQPIVQGLDGNTPTNNVAENSCQLCGINKLVYRTRTFCSSCNKHIKHGLKIYCGVDERGTRHCFCHSCFMGSRRSTMSFQGSSIPKAKLQKMTNDHEDDEPWVQCDKCRLWQHQVCALYISKRDFEGKAAYLCPKCHSQGIKNGEHVPLPKTAAFGAKDLPTSLLSDYIEQRLFKRLKQDREERAKALQKNVDEVPGAVDLVVRVVLSADKLLKVDQNFLDVCSHENYPTEFPYKSKVILLFQKIEGVDVCLFAMYVQEFGSECGRPNQRCVYISYLDSVRYFRPEIKAASGEALRTFVYHEILIGYLDYCKKRGFAACYIWACPPSKGDDYILCGHPETQKTPKPDKLRQWYKAMLGKAAKESIVVDCTNLYDHLFAPTGEWNVKITAARMPYFDGDCWSAAAVNMSKNLQQESRDGSEKKVKKVVSKRTFIAMGHSRISTDATKDILLMQQLGQAMLNAKQDFLVVRLQFSCTHCCEVILGGARWICRECKNFQLCARCHDANQDCNEESTHTSSKGKKHRLFQVADHIPVDTEDGDAILEDNCFEDRTSFVKFCEENHYLFDTLRRAKHSSMMMLYYLQARNDSEEKKLIGY